MDVLLLACWGKGNGGEGENYLKEGGNYLKEGGKCQKEGVEEVDMEEREEVRRGQFLEMESVKTKDFSAVAASNGKVYV